MNRRSAILGLCWACSAMLVACSGAPRQAGPGETRYRVNDYVVYRYEGTFTEQPVVLREEVLGQQGNQLEILVEARRGDEQLRWVQIVTDTPENQQSDHIDELYELNGDERVRLENANNEDVYRLYRWTLPPFPGQPTDVQVRSEQRGVAGVDFTCDIETGTLPEHGGASFEFATCPDFLWINGPAFIHAPDGTPTWQRRVEEFGP